ncbi:MAG: hypothetical protein ACTSQ9_05285 [Candidatus Hodarchaeales archaeon]
MEESKIIALYELMLRSRQFEEMIIKIWKEGKKLKFTSLFNDKSLL